MLRHSVVLSFIIGSIILIKSSSGCRNKDNDRCCNDYYKKDGHCQECPPGTIGVSCSAVCPEGYYGRLCLSVCNCSTGFICKTKDGCTSITTGNPVISILNNRFEMAGLIAFGSLATAGLILLLLYLKKCCRRQNEHPGNIEDLLQTLTTTGTRQISQGDVEEVGAVGGREEGESKPCPEMEISMNEYSTIVTLSSQISSLPKQELDSDVNMERSRIQEQNRTSEASDLPLSEERDKQSALLARNLNRSSSFKQKNTIDKKTLQSAKIPFSFQTICSPSRPGISHCNYVINDFPVLGSSEADYDRLNICKTLDDKPNPQGQYSVLSLSTNDEDRSLKSSKTRNNRSCIKEKSQMEHANGLSRNIRLVNETTLEITERKPFLDNEPLASKSKHDEEGKGSRICLKQNRMSKEQENTEEMDIHSVTIKRKRIDRQDIEDKNKNIVQAEIRGSGTKSNYSDDIKEVVEKSKSECSLFVKNRDFSHSQKQDDNENEKYFLNRQMVSCGEETNDVDNVSSRTSKSNAACTSPSDERSYSVVISKRIEQSSNNKAKDMTKDSIERKTSTDQVSLFNDRVVEHTTTSNLCQDKECNKTKNLPDLVIGGQMQRGEYSLALNVTNEDNTNETDPLTFNKESDKQLIETKFFQKARDKELNKCDQNKISMDWMNDDNVYEDYENNIKIDSTLTERLTKWKGRVFSTLTRMQAKVKSSGEGKVERSKSLKMHSVKHVHSDADFKETLKMQSMKHVHSEADLTEPSMMPYSLIMSQGDSVADRNVTNKSDEISSEQYEPRGAAKDLCQEE